MKSFLRAHATPVSALSFLVFLASAPIYLRAQSPVVEIVLHEFGRPQGSGPDGRLVRTSAGDLFGTTEYGGTSGNGTVFKIDPVGNATVIHSFGGTPDGAIPWDGLISDAAGNLYGTTSLGGTFNEGTVYKIDPTGHETVLYSFAGGNGGGHPFSGVVRDGAGSLYGTTEIGGSSGLGTVYKIDPMNRETVLHSFGLHASEPTAGVIFDAAGNLYGTTGVEGPSNLGTVYKIDSAGHFRILHSFVGGNDGAYSASGVILDTEGNLYGTTQGGGAFHVGTVYRIDVTGQETILYSFAGRPGPEAPASALLRDAAGNLYGTTYYGGSSGRGTVYRVDTAGNVTVLHSFAGDDGAFPLAGLIGDGLGNLFGTTYGGGVQDFGIVFELQRGAVH